MIETQVFLKGDLTNILRALVFTACANPGPSPQWQAGYIAALNAVAVSIGVYLPAPQRRTLPIRDT